MSAALSRSFLDIDVEMGVDNGRMLAYLAAHGEVLSKTFHDSRVVVHCRISQHFISRMENDGVVIRPQKVIMGSAVGPFAEGTMRPAQNCGLFAVHNP